MPDRCPIPTRAEPYRLLIGLPRPLWIGLTAAVLLIGWLAIQFGMPIYRQQAAIREIKQLGGRVDLLKDGPSWLYDLIGDAPMELIEEPLSADLPNFSNEGLRHINWLAGLKELHLMESTITDAGLVYVSGMTNLETLSFNNSLDNLLITDAGLMQLKGLPGLKRLFLGGAQITDSGLAALNPRLEYLDVSFTDVGDPGFANISRLANLEYLNLHYTGFTDAGLARLCALTRLHEINLRRTQISDAGLTELARLPSLKILDLRETRVTDAGIAELQRALPGITIIE
jgi:hypothetical protein